MMAALHRHLRRLLSTASFSGEGHSAWGGGGGNGRDRSTNELTSKDPSWVDYYSMCICVHDWFMSGFMCPCIVHIAECMYSTDCRTPADGWLVLIHSRGTNLSRQLDSLTDLTADNPAGSVRCNNPGRGVILFGSCQHETQCFPALYSSAEPKSW